MVPEAGYPFHRFGVSGFPRRPSLALMRGRCAAPGARRGVPADPPAGASRRWCSAPAATCPARCWRPPRRHGCPAALLEVDAHMGVANRLASPLVRRVFLAFPIEGRGRRTTWSPAARCRGGARATREQRRSSSDSEPQVVLVFGGSLGARTPQHRGRGRLGGVRSRASR